MKKITLLLLMMFAAVATNAQIIITEIMYNPPESGSDLHEFIELYNDGTTAVDLTGYSFGQGVEHTFTSGTINSGEYFVIAGNSVELDNTFGAGTADAEWSSGALSNGGETIELLDASLNVVDIVVYDDSADWPDADGDGPSIRFCDFSLDNNLASSWTASDEGTGVIINGIEIIGTPGQASNCPVLSNPQISALENETLLFPSPSPAGEVTLKTPLSSEVEVSICNGLGAIVRSQTVSNSEAVSTEGLAAGVYFVQLTVSGNTTTKRLVVQ